MRYVTVLHELEDSKIEIDRLINDENVVEHPPKTNGTPNNLLELCEGYKPVDIEPKELYMYFELIMDKKFSKDLSDIKAGFHPGRMVYMTIDFYLEKFGRNKGEAMRNLHGLVKMAKYLYSHDKQYAI